MLIKFLFSFSRKCKKLEVLFYSTSEFPKVPITKVINVAIIGAPNSGKSTLVNNIVGRKVCAASNKVHTTTKMARAICCEGDTQIIFLDTPGLVTSTEQKKYNLPESMLKACHKSLNCAHVIGIVHDISNPHIKDNLPKNLISTLEMAGNIPKFLVINKIDLLRSKRQLLSIIRNLTDETIAGKTIPEPINRNPKKDKPTKPRIERGYSKFSDVFLISALHGDGIKDLKSYLVSNARPASLHYSENKWTDQVPERLVEEAVRAKFLDFLAHEIPYKLTTQLEYFEEVEEENKIVCSVAIECPSERLVKLIRGAGGGRLQQIQSHVREDLINMFKKPVGIDLQLKVKQKPSQ